MALNEACLAVRLILIKLVSCKNTLTAGEGAALLNIMSSKPMDVRAVNGAIKGTRKRGRIY